jgi:hypothetical protein
MVVMFMFGLEDMPKLGLILSAQRMLASFCMADVSVVVDEHWRSSNTDEWWEVAG